MIWTSLIYPAPILSAMRGGCAFGVSFLRILRYILIYTLPMLHYSSFSWVFSFLHLVLRGREDVAHAASHVLFFCVRTWDSNAQLPFAIVASLQHKTIAVVSSVFGRREQCSRRACRHLAGSGSAYQVELRTVEAEGEFENGIWTLASRYSAILEAVTSDQF